LTLTTSNYVEPVSVDKLMHGAMHGLADSLDADSAYLTPEETRAAEAGAPLPAGEVGITLARQYYLRVIAVCDGSPADRAGLATGDYIRIIDRQPTRELSAWEGTRLLHGTPGTTVRLTILRGNAADPHIVELTREVLPPRPLSARVLRGQVAYVRVPEFSDATPRELASIVQHQQQQGARSVIIDVRNTARGPLTAGVAAARPFVASGTLAIQETRGSSRQTLAAQPGDGTVTLPMAVLVDAGTWGAGELFAAALAGNKLAELIGERTSGGGSLQRLFKLPDGSGLWMSYAWFLTPAGEPIHERGLVPAVMVEQPEVDFGAPKPSTDPVLEKAVERLAKTAGAS